MTERNIDRAIEDMRTAGKPYVIATVVRTVPPTSAKAGDRALLDADGMIAGWVGGGCALPAVRKNAKAALADGETRLVRISRDLDTLETGIIGYPMTCQSGGTIDIFIEPVMPKPQLVIVGKTAIAQALCSLAPQIGFDVTLAAPDANREDFGAARDYLDDIDAVAALRPHPAAVVVATQGSGDARGLGAALASGAAYVGFIASPKKGARLKESLKNRGLDPQAVDSIDAPAGLDIGARTPEQIAISVLAEIIQRQHESRTIAPHTDDEQSQAG